MSIKKRFIESLYSRLSLFLKLFLGRSYTKTTELTIQQPVVYKFNDEFRLVRHKGQNSLIDNKKDIIVNLPYNHIMLPQEGLALVFNTDLDKLYNSDDDEYFDFGFIDEKANLVIPMIYTGGDDFCGGLAVVKKNGKWGFINSSGQTVIDFEYEDAMSFEEDLAAVQLEGKWGFIDKQGQIIIKPKYQEANSFNLGLAAVKQDDQWGYIDRDEKFIVSNEFDWTNIFREGLAAVESNGKYGYIDIVNPT